MQQKNDKQINVYVRAADYERIQKLSKLTGMSMSRIAWLALTEGYPKVQSSLLKYHVKKELPKTNVDIK